MKLDFFNKFILFLQGSVFENKTFLFLILSFKTKSSKVIKIGLENGLWLKRNLQ